MLRWFDKICLWWITILVHFQSFGALYWLFRVIFGVFEWFFILHIIYRLRTSTSGNQNLSLWRIGKIADFKGEHFWCFDCLAMSHMVVWATLVKHADVICLKVLVVCKISSNLSNSAIVLSIESGQKLHPSDYHHISSLQVIPNKPRCKKHVTMKNP